MKKKREQAGQKQQKRLGAAAVEVCSATSGRHDTSNFRTLEGQAQWRRLQSYGCTTGGPRTCAKPSQSLAKQVSRGDLTICG